MKGYIHIYIGEGKGKTTCAVGMAIRAAGAGKRVAFVQFDKGSESTHEHYNERNILRTVSSIDLFCYGCERMLPAGEFRFSNTDDDRDQAEEALKKARSLIKSSDYFLVILDEAITCVKAGLLKESDLIDILEMHKSHPVCELVLTGR